MKQSRGFIGLPALLAIVAVLLAAGGGTAWYLEHRPSAPPNPELLNEIQGQNQPQASTSTEPSSGAVITPPSGPTGTLLSGYKDIGFRYVTGITEPAAAGLCALIYADTCVWNQAFIHPAPYQIASRVEDEPTIGIDSPAPGTTISYGTIVPIVIRDHGPAGRHQVYLVHRNLIGEVDEVHEAHIVSETGDAAKTLTWDGNEVYINESGTEQISQLKAGHYYLVVANVDTAVSGALPNWINLVTDIRGKDVPTGDLMKPYVKAGTPILNSWWDGRGVFDNGGGGEDTITLVGKRKDVEIYRGNDMPSQDQYNVLVIFRRTDGVVIVITNVENIQFDDMSLKTNEVVSYLDQQPSGAAYPQPTPSSGSSAPAVGESMSLDIGYGFSFTYPTTWHALPQSEIATLSTPNGVVKEDSVESADKLHIVRFMVLPLSQFIAGDLCYAYRYDTQSKAWVGTKKSGSDTDCSQYPASKTVSTNTTVGSLPAFNPTLGQVNPSMFFLPLIKGPYGLIVETINRSSAQDSWPVDSYAQDILNSVKLQN